MDDLTPDEWAYWCASEKLDPDGGQRELASLVATQIINAIVSIGSAMGGGTVSDDDMLPIDAMVPFRYPESREDERLRKSMEALASLKGLGNGGK